MGKQSAASGSGGGGSQLAPPAPAALSIAVRVARGSFSRWSFRLPGAAPCLCPLTPHMRRPVGKGVEAAPQPLRAPLRRRLLAPAVLPGGAAAILHTWVRGAIRDTWFHVPASPPACLCAGGKGGAQWAGAWVSAHVFLDVGAATAANQVQLVGWPGVEGLQGRVGPVRPAAVDVAGTCPRSQFGSASPACTSPHAAPSLRTPACASFQAPPPMHILCTPQTAASLGP